MIRLMFRLAALAAMMLRADSWYDEGRNNILGNGVHARIDLDTDDVRVGLRDEGVTAINIVTQIDLADVTSAHVAASAAALPATTVGTVAAGVFDHGDQTLTAVSGATVESLDYFDFTPATDATRPLIWNIDGWTGLPLTPNGGDVTLAPNASGVYSLNAA